MSAREPVAFIKRPATASHINPAHPNARDIAGTLADYIVLDWGPQSSDLLAPSTDWRPDSCATGFFRHRHLAAQQLISTLAAAIDAARRPAHETVLAELPAAPIASVAPVKLATRRRLPPPRRSCGG